MKALKVADLFCGAGGTSAGVVEACERLGYRCELTAINHWPVAVASHQVNHPEARHLCTGIDEVNPRSLYAEGELDLLWASPECTHHSVARGGRPMNDQSRATAWCVVRWAEALRPGVILIENVPEFENWGGIGTDGRPLKSKRGETFRAWVAALESLGYRVGWRTLCAADYGDPTTRERLFVQAVRGRRRVVWPEATHAKDATADLFGATRKPWVPARDIIDWNLKAQSIYERTRPLSPKTMARIMAGLKKFGLKAFIVPAQTGEKRTRSVDKPLQTVTCDSRGIGLVEPFIVAWDHQSGSGTWSAHDPLSTVTSKARHGVVEPFLVELRGTSREQVENSARSLDAPISSVATSGAHHALAEPFLVQVNHGNGTGGHQANVRRSRSVAEPLPTVCGARGEWALCEPAVLPQQSDGRLRPVGEPLPTVAASGAIALVEPFLIAYYGTAEAREVGRPLDTVTTRDRFGLVRPEVEVRGQRYLLDIRFRMLQPHELAAAQGFRAGYNFTGNKTEQVRQIGNAVPRRLARAIATAALTQNPCLPSYE